MLRIMIVRESDRWATLSILSELNLWLRFDCIRTSLKHISLIFVIILIGFVIFLFLSSGRVLTRRRLRVVRWMTKRRASNFFSRALMWRESEMPKTSAGVHWLKPACVRPASCLPMERIYGLRHSVAEKWSKKPSEKWAWNCVQMCF